MSTTYRAALLLGLAALAGCGGARQGGGGEGKPTPVSVAALVEAPIADYEDFTGRTEAVESVTLKARATGYLNKVLFEDGEFVKKGQVLYEIDDRLYVAAVKNAEAAIKRTEASVDKASADMTRARKMELGSAISREDYDQIVARKLESQATLISDKATLEKAKLNLGFCKVTSPIDGVVSRTAWTPGNLVTQDQTTLTNIVRVDPIYAYFDVDERTTLRLKQRIREEVSDAGIAFAGKEMEKLGVPATAREEVTKLLSGRVTPEAAKKASGLLEGSGVGADWVSKVVEKYPKFPNYRQTTVPVFLATQIDKGYPHKGHIDFVDNQLNASTGTLRVRGNFPNPNRVLGANLFVRVRLPIGDPSPALLVSEAAVVTQQDRKFLFVVNADDEVEAKPVRLGPMRNGLRVVEGGVSKGDVVIVSGLQRVQPGAKVSPTKVAMPGDESAKPAK